MSRITVTVEGGLLPDDLLERIADGSAPGQRPADFGIASGRLSDEIMKAFSDAQSYWTAFRHRYERASKGGRESITTITREGFVVPLLEALGYGGPGYKLVFSKAGLPAADQSFVISHKAGEEASAPPVNIVGADDKLDERGASRRSAHSAVQEYLNLSDCVWGLVTNGNKMRLLRNSSRIAKPRYIEFDLAGMMESSVYSDFHLLYRLLQRTRLPHSSADASECWLEKYYLDGIEQGSRVRDKLRDGVVEALSIFGNAFLSHEKSAYLREQISKGHLSAAAFYRELLRLVYRLLFLMVAEERRLMFPDSRENQERRAIFSDHYGINRLRAHAEGYIGDDPEIDIWESLKQAFRILRDDRAAHMMGLAALNGELFGPHGCPHLDGGGDDARSAFCRNDQLLRAIHCLSTFDDDGVRRRVNFGALDVEELGSVYESLLEYHPQLSASPASFDLAWGSERKTTGSYYTPPDLVRELINSALIPVMEERLKPAKTKEDREQAILSMRVIDPAAGSGHFLLAAARQIGRELARIRTGEEEPPPSAYRHAVRDVIRECIHAVDKNPLAVDLCKVALWIEGHNAGQPLSFLDHHVKCGDSLVGVFDLKVLEEGVPDDAYKPVEGDDKAAAKHYRQLNRETKKNHPTLPQLKLPSDVVAALEALSHRDERTPEDVSAKEREYEALTNSPAMQNLENACNAWTAAFFIPLRMPEFRGRDLVPTTGTVWERLSGRQVYGLLDAELTKAKTACSFFHWPVEFPDVFARGGWDVVLGNPPWDRIKISEKEFFANVDSEIADAPNKSVRQKLIGRLPSSRPELATAWRAASRSSETKSKFLRQSDRFPLCGRGDINTYSVFAELDLDLLSEQGRAGVIVPSGIATEETTKAFFETIMGRGALASLWEFENEGFFGAGQGHMVRFALTTILGAGYAAATADFFFQGKAVAELRESERHFFLSADDLSLLNPNTRTAPIFRTHRDAEITKSIYSRVPILISEEGGTDRSWPIDFLRMFDLTNDSHLFRSREELRSAGYRLKGNIFESETQRYLPLYEAKMISQLDHRHGDYSLLRESQSSHVLPEPSLSDLEDPQYSPMSRYWVPEPEVKARLQRRQNTGWLLGWRDVTDSRASARTVISSILPLVGVGNSFPLIIFKGHQPMLAAWLAGILSSFVLDFVARQKIGGIHLNYLQLKQLPILPFEHHDGPLSNVEQALRSLVLQAILELTYCSNDLAAFAHDLGYSGSPFKWNAARRNLIRCEIDAVFFQLYAVTRDDASYILESFPVVKRRDEERFGEYRTKRVILEIYDAMAEAIRTRQPYQTRLDPPPGDPRAAHQKRDPESRQVAD